MADKNNLLEMTDEQYDAWFREATGFNPDDPAQLNEEDLISALSDAIRTDNRDMKAKYYVQLANMALAMADKTLGCQRIVVTSLVLMKH